MATTDEGLCEEGEEEEVWEGDGGRTVLLLLSSCMISLTTSPRLEWTEYWTQQFAQPHNTHVVNIYCTKHH